MKTTKVIITIITSVFILIGTIYSQKTQNEDLSKKSTTNILSESNTEYRTTDWNSRLLTSPNSNTVLTRIPENTKLIILEKKGVQQGKMLNGWYKVQYNGYTGWTSGWNMKEEEKLIICSTEEMELNYIKQIGSKPENNPLTGKIQIIDDWLKNNMQDYKSLNYIQWYKPYILNNSWNCRVEFTVNNLLGIPEKINKVFQIRDMKIIDIFDLN